MSVSAIFIDRSVARTWFIACELALRASPAVPPCCTTPTRIVAMSGRARTSPTPSIDMVRICGCACCARAGEATCAIIGNKRTTASNTRMEDHPAREGTGPRAPYTEPDADQQCRAGDLRSVERQTTFGYIVPWWGL